MKDKCKGGEFSDPRLIQSMIREYFDENVWLDIEQLDSTNDAGMFGQMAQGLKNMSWCLGQGYKVIKQKRLRNAKSIALHADGGGSCLFSRFTSADGRLNRTAAFLGVKDMVKDTGGTDACAISSSIIDISETL